MALLAIAMLTDKDVPGHVSMTGTISEDGRVGPVGGVFEKVKEGSKTGIKLFLIPKGEAVQTVKLNGRVASVNLGEYATEEWGIKVVEVETIEDALRFAFTDPAKIDVNASAGAVPEFVPEKIELPERLGPFKVMATNYIKGTRQVTAEARNSLSSSLLEDPSVTQGLLEVLNGAEQAISKAEILNEQNYLYSAANLAFLARVNAIVVEEVSSNPQLLQENSAAFDLRLLELKKELDNFENDLSGNVPKEGVEWFASAQQRFTYAKKAVQKLTSQQTIIVGGKEEDKAGAALKRVQDYAFAVSWLDVSKDFYSLSLESNGLVKRPKQVSEKVDGYIASAEAAVKSIGLETGIEDITRRLDSAKSEKEMGWSEAAIFDAASAKGLA